MTRRVPKVSIQYPFKGDGAGHRIYKEALAGVDVTFRFTFKETEHLIKKLSKLPPTSKGNRVLSLPLTPEQYRVLIEDLPRILKIAVDFTEDYKKILKERGW